MKIIKNLIELNQFKSALKSSSPFVFIPTMGNLHKGHLSLIDRAKQIPNAQIIVSIYVNPTQFGPNEDFDTYPRTLEEDLRLIEPLGIDAIFLPDAEMLYPNGLTSFTSIHVPSLDNTLCSLSRPHFFKGVCTVVLKLLNLIQPTHAIFGQKDYQQFLIIQQMVSDLFIPTEIIKAPIVRETNGLAMSSRNRYLIEAEQNNASSIYRIISEIKADILRTYSLGSINLKYLTSLEDHASMALADLDFKVDYLKILDAKTLKPFSITEEQTQGLEAHEVLIAIAAKLGKTRLIDNIVFNL